MARKKTEWPASAERKFARLAKKGASAQEIARELGADGVVGASAATVGRRLRELFGDRRAGKGSPDPVTDPPLAPARAPRGPTLRIVAVNDVYSLEHLVTEGAPGDGAPPDIPTDPDDLAQAPLEELRWWLDKVRAAYAKAETDQNVAAQASLAGRARDFLAAIQKHSPPDPPDLNAAPDMIAAAEKCVTMLFKKVDRAIGAARP